jgi:NitT/TauT family transport system ATP-binding protein
VTTVQHQPFAAEVTSASASTASSAPDGGPSTAARPGGPAVVLRNVTKVFGHAGTTLVALDRMSMDIPAGHFVALVGASGCGKTTLLHILAGLEPPTSGTVEVAESRPALMFQDAALFPWLTVAQNLELALRLRGIGRAERRARAAHLLETVRLEGFGDRRAHELSGGMRQRVALARALAQGSQLLLMDEPFGSLDAITRDLLHDELERIWQEVGGTVVLVTHNVREAVRLGDRVVVLSSRPGRVVDQYAIDLPRPRSLNTADVAAASAHITERLRQEVRRHGSGH